LNDISKRNEMFVVFDQLAEVKLDCSLNLVKEKTNLIFGPEAGLSNKELDMFPTKKILSLSDSRLRTETAVITAASILTGC
ncbi:MAG: 16S rRNA (uracil(1498)-N(3))-methyltransferase, partial [Melioribacteraceae bacterium]|nr:16S rRNA (uracil(1498)-N(3))-methyltransferase [Melioribacteraceae bacterium]